LTPASDVTEPKRISVVIVSFNRIDSLRRSLAQLGDQHQVLVVDNGSQDGSHALDEGFPAARFIRLPKNFGLTKALNIGIRAAEGTYIFLLHDDVAISGEAVSKLADYLEQNQDAAAVAPLLLTASGEPAPQVRELPSPAEPDPLFHAAQGGTEIAAPCISGAAIMFRSFFLRALRQIDERYGNYGSEIELCMQVRRANRRTVIFGDVTAVHEGLRSPMTRSALAGDRVAGIAVFLGKHNGFMSAILYRLKCALSGLFTFNFKVAAGALAGAKIDGTS
jgi:N-acetylglucosaminyl-diphospho-decaprenol L-rhamnosyltransferase